MVIGTGNEFFPGEIISRKVTVNIVNMAAMDFIAFEVLLSDFKVDFKVHLVPCIVLELQSNS